MKILKTISQFRWDIGLAVAVILAVAMMAWLLRPDVVERLDETPHHHSE